MSKVDGYVFLLSLHDVDAILPFQIAPGHFFTKANPQQIENIKRALKSLCQNPINFPPYEHDVQVIDKNDGKRESYNYSDLPKERWRYWVIEFEGYNTELPTIQSACFLSSKEIILGFQFFITEADVTGIGWHDQQINTFFNDYTRISRVPNNLTQEDLKLVSRYYDLLKKLPVDFDHINRAFRRLDELNSLPRFSELSVIGLFSIIESLITHAPHNNESADSIIHQVRTKIPMLRKRFDRELGHEHLFGNIDESKLWSKLYGYRSKIVHGEHATLTGELQVLKNIKTIVIFLRETVKLLLIQALKEPMLLTDLKKC